MNKTILMILIATIALTALASADSDLYDITNVYVDGIEVTHGDISGLELNDRMDIRIYIEGTGNTSTCPDGDVDDCEVEVKVKAWIGGYEYDDIEATSNSFDIEPGVNYRKSLTLNLPEDMNVEDNDYSLYIEVYDSQDEERESYELFVERTSHSLEIMDVVYDSNVNAGDNLPVEVRVKNLGDEKEEDIKVEVSIDEVDSTASYIDELSAFEEDNEDEEDSDSVNLNLDLPEDLESGSYTLLVTVSYNRGHSSIEETYKVNVDGVEETETTEGTAKTTLSLSSTSVDGTQGEDSTFKLKFTNTGSAAETYKVTVNGITQWATSSVSPSSVTVASGSTEEMTITVTPDSDATTGTKDFSLQIFDSSDKLVKDQAMTMNVSENTGMFENTSTMLKVGFTILIVLVILVGLIIAFRKMKGDDDDDEDELEPKEGKTYY